MVTLIAYNGLCVDSSKLLIQIINQYSIETPNIFSPNKEDSINSYFTLNPKNFKEFEFEIVNRWGNLMFKGDISNQKWSGNTSTNEEAQEGVYFYTFSGISENDEKVNLHGFFQLVR